MKLAILFIEDNPLDVELTTRELIKGGLDPNVTVIERIEDISSEIDSNKYDLVISDYKLAGFTGIDVLTEIKKVNPDIPVILVSGTVPDEQAIDAVLAGAKDYILKDNFTRLVPAVIREYEAYVRLKEKKQNDLLLEALFNSPMGVRVADASRTIVTVNERYCAMTGYSKEELIGSSIDILVPKSNLEESKLNYHKCLDQLTESTPVPHRNIKKDGSYIDLLIASKGVIVNNNRCVIDTFQDITEMQKYKRLFEEAGKIAKLGGWQINYATKEEVWTKEVYQIFSLDPNISETGPGFIKKCFASQELKKLETVLSELEKGVPFVIELKAKGYSNTEKWIKFTGQPLIEKGVVMEAFGSIQDITEEKLRELELEKNENRYRFLFENSPHPIIMFSKKDYSISEVNKAAIKLYGYSEEEFLSKTVIDIRPEEDKNSFMNYGLLDIAEDDETRVFNKIRHQTKEGKEILVDVFVKSVTIDGVPTNISVINDSTSKYEAEQKLIETNAVLSKLIESSPIAIMTLDKEGRVFDVWNKKAEELFGWDKEEVLGDVIPYVPADKQEEFQENLRKVFSGEYGSVFEIERLRKGGEKIFLRELATPIESEEGDIMKIMFLVEDITAQRKTEKALSNSEKKYRQLVEASHDMVWRIDKDGRFSFVNSASKLILGYSPDEIIGNTFLEYVSEDQVKDVEKIFRKVLSGATFEHFDLKMVKKDGSISYMTATSYPMIDNDGSILGSSGAATDISHIKEYQQQLEETLREKEVLIKEIHHRVKNNLAVISGILGLQALHLTDENTIATFEQSQSRIKSIAMIHEHLYQTELFTSVEIKSYLKELISEIKHTFVRFDKDIEIEIYGDEVQLNMNQAVPFGILANELITNSLKFAFEGQDSGRIDLLLKKDDNRILFHVSDNGIGLPEDFEYRKKSSLGMTLVETVTSQLNGVFSWDKTQKDGTKFCVEFSMKDMNNWAKKKLN